MKGRYFLIATLFLAFTSLMAVENNTSVFQEFVAKSLSVGDWNKQMAEEPGRILDVRTESEYEDGHIRGAILCDVTQDNFVEELNALELNKEMPVYVYCRSGGRSKQAMEILQKQGFRLIYDLDSGITGYKKAGGEVIK